MVITQRYRTDDIEDKKRCSVVGFEIIINYSVIWSDGNLNVNESYIYFADDEILQKNNFF